MESQRSLRYGALAGLSAGIFMTLVMIILRFLLNTVSLPEVLAEWSIDVTPARVFSAILGVLEAYAKPILFVTLLITQVVLGGAFGALYAFLLEPTPLHKGPRWLRAMLFALVLWLVTMVVVVPIAGGGIFGGSLAARQINFVAITFFPYMIYGWFLASAYKDLFQRVHLDVDPSERRYFLKWTILGATGLVLGGYAARLIWRGGPTAGTKGISRGEMPLEVTPNDDFYIVSKNFIDPVVSKDGWELRVEGMVEEPYTLTYDELISLPWVEEFITMECISNYVGGDLISNANWRGVPLKNILERAKLKPGVVDIASFARDGYSESMPLEKALESQVLVAYMMNDEPLPFKHGFPARLVVPGLYGEKCSKWLKRLEAVDDDYLGFWQQKGWGDEGLVKTTSQIRVPDKGEDLTIGEVLVGGLAFAGDKGISKVELSTDGGTTWLPTTLRDPLSPYTWVLWTTKWVPSATGEFQLVVRATDDDGQQQITAVHPIFPDGATGLHDNYVLVEADKAS